MKIILNLLPLALLVILSACGQPNTAEVDAAEVDQDTAPATEMASEPMSGLQIGDVAPDFKLEGTDGEMHSLATMMDANGEKPKGYAVTFTCNTCPYAKMYETRLVALHEKLSKMGYPLIAIQPNDVELKPDDNMEAMKERAADRGFGFAYVIDADQSVYPQYGASKTPEVYLLDADYKLRYHGAIDDSPQDEGDVTKAYVEMAVMALEKGEDPSPAEVKAIGCGIKAK